MIYREIPPHPQLRVWVHCYWELEGFVIEPQVIYPDGRPEIIFHFGDPFSRDGREQPRALYAGQLTSSVRVQPTGRAGVFGVRFTSVGGWAFARFPQQDAVGIIIDLDDVCGALGRLLAARILESTKTSERVAAVERALLPRLPPPPDVIDLLANAVSEGRMLSRDARLESGLGERQWQRVFQTRTGLAPKLLERIGRFRQALQLSRTYAWADVAARCGYSDQAHLVRDFRQFAGSPPTQCTPDLFT